MSDQKPFAVFYAGTNGSGKSTLREFSPYTVKYNIDPDAIARNINPESPRSVDLQAGKQALKMLDTAISEKASFSFENTLVGQTALKRMETAKKSGYHVELRYVGLDSADLNVARVAERVKNGGHHIEEETIRRRYIDSRNNLPAATLIADNTIIYDNSKTFSSCLHVSNGTVEKIHPDKKMPDWIETAYRDIAEKLKERKVAGQELLDMPTKLPSNRLSHIQDNIAPASDYKKKIP